MTRSREAAGDEAPFRALLRRLRAAAGLTQEELAERARLSARAISALERGVNRAPQRSTLLALMAALQLEPGDAASFHEVARRTARLSWSLPSQQEVEKDVTAEDAADAVDQGPQEHSASGAEPHREVIQGDAMSGETATQERVEVEIIRQVIQALAEIRNGDFARRIRVARTGEGAELARAVNDELEQLYHLMFRMMAEITRITREVGSDGWFGGQAEVPDAAGSWKHLINAVNMMAYQLTDQMRDFGQVLAALNKGETGRLVRAEAQGETLQVKEAINALVDRARSAAAEP